MNETIYDWVKGQEAIFTRTVEITDGWSWNLKEHIRRCFLYKHSQFERDNENRDKRPFKNIVRGFLDVRYRTEGFDVKDIELYVNDPEIYYKSFLVKKFHEDWALEHSIDTFIDEVVESIADYGGVLVKNVNEVKPDVVDLQTIAFCNQHNILSRPFAIKHMMSPDELRDMQENGWGEESNGATIGIEALIDLTKDEQELHDGEIEVYEVYGVLSESWLKGGESKKGVRQEQIIAYYKNSEDKETGVTLFKSKVPKELFKFLAPDKVFNRALGWGGIESLFDPQVWTNFSEIQMMSMLEISSKILYKTTDPTFKTRNNLNNVDQGQVLTLAEGKDISQLDTSPRNLVVFENAIRKWQDQAQMIESASEPLLGQPPSSGTPFKLYEAQLVEGKGTHHYRQGKIAVFIDEVYRDWVLPYIAKEITKEQKFLSELSADELQKVSNAVVSNRTAEFIKERILNGELITPEDEQEFALKAREQFLKGGNKRFLKILKDELSDAPLKVKTNIAGKQKNLALLTDKLVNVLRQFISTPAIRQDPDMVKLLNVILESSGLTPIMFGSGPQPQQQENTTGGATEPLKALSQAVQGAAPANA